jgi:hypothetical protein
VAGESSFHLHMHRASLGVPAITMGCDVHLELAEHPPHAHEWVFQPITSAAAEQHPWGRQPYQRQRGKLDGRLLELLVSAGL